MQLKMSAFNWIFNFVAFFRLYIYKIQLDISFIYINLHFLAPNNQPLLPNSYYTVFIRVYVTDNIYTSTDWYPVVSTLKEDNVTKQDDKISKSK